MRKTGSAFQSFVLGFTVFTFLFAWPSAAQQPAATPQPAFDVVSIKRVPPPPPPPPGASVMLQSSCRYQPERVLCQQSILNLVKEAYQVRFELEAPKWMGDIDHVFAVQATMPSGTTPEAARLMLRQMLAERFGLKVRWEKRDLPVYALVPGKHGARLKPATSPTRFIETPAGSRQLSAFSTLGQYFLSTADLDFFARDFENHVDLDRPVVNMTGLTGRYEVDLHWTPTEQSGPVRTMKDPGFVGAVQEQMGLRLEKRTLPYDVLIVEHCEGAPTEN